MRPVQRAWAVLAVGCLSVIIGVFGLLGLWWGLVVAGCLVMTGALFLADVDDAPEARR